jgi:hypothetical protein
MTARVYRQPIVLVILIMSFGAGPAFARDAASSTGEVPPASESLPETEAPSTVPPVLSHAITLFPQLDLQRSLGPDVYLRAIYEVLAWEHFRGAAGLSLSFTPVCIDGYFLELGVENVAGTGLGARIKFMGDEYPEYGRAANTINPYLVWRYAFVDLAFGIVWRFLVTDPDWRWCLFDYDSFMVEPIFQFKIGFIFEFFDRIWTLNISLSNQDEFYAGNFGALTILLGNRFALDDRSSVFFDFLWRPSGTIALSAVNSVFVFRAGGRVSL